MKAAQLPASCAFVAPCSSRVVSSVHSRVAPCKLLAVTRPARRTQSACAARAEGWNPPTVSDTKQAFYESFRKPIPPIYNTVIQELLVQQHLMRWNKFYKYNEVFALGFISVVDQVLEGFPGPGKEELLTAYLSALQEDAEQYRRDAEKMEGLAKELSSSSDLQPNSSGNELQQVLAKVAEDAKNGEFSYSKFFAIGLFRLLELTGAKDPKALETLTKAVHVRTEAVNRDLKSYKGILTKLSAAKELMAEMTKREQRKQAERDAEKANKAQQAEKEPEKANA